MPTNSFVDRNLKSIPHPRLTITSHLAVECPGPCHLFEPWPYLFMYLSCFYLIFILRKCNYCQYRTLDTKYLKSQKSTTSGKSASIAMHESFNSLQATPKSPPFFKGKGQRSSSKGLFQKLKLIMLIERPLCLTFNYAAFAPMNEVSNMSITTTT